MSNSNLNLSQIPLVVGYINGKGWLLTELLATGNVEYSPKAFEAEYGYLPYPLPPKPRKNLKRKLPEYYAHRKPAPKRGKGFGVVKCG